MGRKLTIPKHTLTPSGGQDSSTDFSLDKTVCEFADKLVYLVAIDPTVDGEILVETCNEQFEKDEDWKPLNFGESTALVGSVETDYRFEIQISFKKARIRWINNAGTGNIVAAVYGVTEGA